MERQTPDTYVIEITTFSYKAEVDPEAFWVRDAKIQEDYTSKQPGFISRESAAAEDGEIVVVVRWNTMADAAASMNKFMGEQSVADYANMIEGPSMKMKRFQVK
ncbi:MAG: hypothetical protein AAFN10_29060 [Bacteroidota bacterium]